VQLVNTASSKIAAYGDVDGTLTDTTIVTPLVWMKRRALPPPLNWLWLASLAARGPWWWVLDQFSRRASNVAIYSNYRGVSTALVRQLAEAYYRERILPKFFPRAKARLEEFRRAGVRLVLVTGGLDLFMEPMARDLHADCLAPKLAETDGVFTGQLMSAPFTGEEKARREHAAAHGIDLAQCLALGDALGDLPMLECVGKPLAVNPDARLAKVAAERKWPIERWKQ
jgi:HAD superfamily hydrolase (TIGR01490 family)